MIATSNITATGTRETYAAFVCDEISSQILLPVISERDWNPDMIFSGGVASAVRALGGMPCPEFLIVDLSESEDPRADMQSLADVCEPGTVVLALGTLNDVTLYRDLLHAGVHDYLVKPLTADVLRDAIRTAEEAMFADEEVDDTAPKGDTRQLVCVGVRGGIGTSTMVANLSWLFADQGKKTALLDLDLFFGTSAMQFDLEPGRGLSDALDNPRRVDGLFLERAVVKPHENLSILGCEAPIGGMSDPAEGALEQLVDALGENFDCVVVDVPRQLLGTHVDVLRSATDIVVVTDFSLTAARDCIRLLAHIKQIAPEADIYVAANKVGMVPSEVDEKDFENSIEHAVDVKIPFDVKAMMTATQRGTVIADDAPSARVSLSYLDLLRAVTSDDSIGKATKSWFGKLFSR
ncbi:AAA family ATPase [Kordiimonas aestuarii]|uniref:AAA family ATPase n=1 Tax=Kordiimonas aestuarii TaxID=1005925 RepID=UPI0021D0F268|nr:AAA family ATPase [Kordiimonas aestuarii]